MEKKKVIHKINNNINSKSNEISQTKDLKYLFKKENKKIYIEIITYLEYKDIISLRLSNKFFFSVLNSKITLKIYALKGLIDTPNNRLLFYNSCIKIRKLFDSVKTELKDYKIESNIYNNILKLADESKESNKKYFHVCDEISRDISRTFYTKKFLEGNGKTMLFNILSALAFIRPEIGYCQGMNFIVGALINFIDNEEKCFWIFLSFIDNFEMNFLYLKNMPDYSIRVYQLNFFIKEYFPDLALHFKKNQINPDVFFSKWILTIFSNYLPFDVLYKVWDVFILDKWKAIFKFSLMILNTMKDKLLTMDLITFSKFIKDNKNNSSLINFNEFSEHYKDYKITNRQLYELREDFFIDQLKTKLEDNNAEWETDQKDYVDNYKKELEEHLNNFRTIIEQLEEEINKVNVEYERKNKKYEEKLKKVNELKMKLEAQIEVKAGYENVIKRFSSNSVNPNMIEGMDNINNENKVGLKNSQELKGNKKFKFNFIKKNTSEYDKLQKKIQGLEKDINISNKALFDEYKKLDKKKMSFEKVTKAKEKLKKQLNDIIQNSEKIKKELLKNLSEKLKLTAKFVSTNQY